MAEQYPDRVRSLTKHGVDWEARESEGFPDSTASASFAGYWFWVFLHLPLLPKTVRSAWVGAVAGRLQSPMMVAKQNWNARRSSRPSAAARQDHRTTRRASKAASKIESWDKDDCSCSYGD